MATNLKLKAPSGKFRVICVDTFDGTDWIEGDYDTQSKAMDVAKYKGDTMLKTHVYDDTVNIFLRLELFKYFW